MKSNIALIGFMGAGKSTVGRALAKKLDIEFVELDALVVQHSGKTISQIFGQGGEARFRQLESEVVAQVADRSNSVLACGGGIILKQENIDRLKKSSVIVYLRTEPSVILKRVKQGKVRRPLLEVDDPVSAVDKLIKFRRPLYTAAADMTVDTSELTIEQVVERICSELKKNESYNFKK